MMYSGNMSIELGPQLPIKTIEPITYHQADSGIVDRATVLFTDNSDEAFSMTIATADNFITEAFEDRIAEDFEDQETEPTFVLPATHLELEDITQVIEGLSAHILAKFAVKQVTG